MIEAQKSVFLSYASEDIGAALKISSALRSAGIDVWFDQSELRGGDAWDTAIRSQIKACALFIPLISRHTRARQEAYFRLEWKLAVDRSYLMSPNRAFLLPVVIDDTPQGDDSVPERFREIHWTRLPEGTTSRDFIAEIARLLSTEAPGPVATAPAPVTAAPLLSRPGALWWVAAILLLVIGYALLNRFVLPKRIVAQLAASGIQLPAAPDAIPEKSIAVLPFADMSEQHDQEYFSDGLTEQLIEQLSKIRDLRVPARTSSFYFKGRPDDIATVAHKLRVANILEGSVRKSGERLRVTAELVRADNGYHVWSETYDRQIKDVFDVQDDIAGAVVAALRLRLDPQQTLAVARTPSTAAYNEYLLARQFYNQGNIEGFRRSVEAYRKAIGLDPLYAAAYAGAAVAEFHLADLTADAVGRARATAAAERAVALAPQEAEYYGARGFLRLNIDWDWAGAQGDFDRALALDPGDSSVQRRYAELLGSLGRLPEAVRAAQRATELDPLSSFAWLQLGKFMGSSEDYEGARRATERALEINPGWTYGLMELGTLQLLQGDAAGALVTFGSITDNEGFRLQGTALAEHSLGHDAVSEHAFSTLRATEAATDAFQIAEVYAWCGDKDHAFAWLERAYQQRDAGLSAVRIDPLLKSLRNDPRFAVLLRQMNLSK
jgi:TolB-like protein